MAKWAMVTGASSGIGEAFARALWAQGHDLILVARRQERLEALAAALQGQGGRQGQEIWVRPADLVQAGAIEALAAEVEARGIALELLVNNAGLGKHGAFVELKAEDDEAMVQLNVVAATRTLRAFLPGMMARKRGGVVNVASSAGFQAIPDFAVYAATKAYLLSLSEALHLEAAPHGVKVVALCPGPVATEFVALAEFKTQVVEKAPMATPEAVVAAALRDLQAGRMVSLPGFMTWVGARLAERSGRGLAAWMAGKLFRSQAGR